MDQKITDVFFYLTDLLSTSIFFFRCQGRQKSGKIPYRNQMQSATFPRSHYITKREPFASRSREAHRKRTRERLAKGSRLVI